MEAEEFLGGSWEGDSVSDRQVHNTSHFYTIGICTVREKGGRERKSQCVKMCVRERKREKEWNIV